MSARLYVEKDFEQLCALFDAYRVFYGQSSDLSLAKAFITERLENQDSVIHVYDDGLGLCGFTQMYHSLSSVQMKPILILNDLFVDADYRRKGVGLALLEVTKVFAMDIGVARLNLMTADDNIEAQSMYEKFGYKRDSFRYYSLDSL